jgi:hypothetical protein
MVREDTNQGSVMFREDTNQGNVMFREDMNQGIRKKRRRKDQYELILKKNAVDLDFISIKKSTIMSILNTGKNKKDKKKSTLPASKSAFIAPKVKANTKSSGKGGKHVGGAQRGA